MDGHNSQERILRLLYKGDFERKRKLLTYANQTKFFSLRWGKEVRAGWGPNASPHPFAQFIFMCVFARVFQLIFTCSRDCQAERQAACARVRLFPAVVSAVAIRLQVGRGGDERLNSSINLFYFMSSFVSLCLLSLFSFQFLSFLPPFIFIIILLFHFSYLIFHHLRLHLSLFFLFLLSPLLLLLLPSSLLRFVLLLFHFLPI